MIENKRLALLVYTGGIFVFYFLFGLLQEKITRATYTYETHDEDGKIQMVEEKYTYSLSLVFTMCFVNYLFAKVNVISHKQQEDKTPVKYYMSVALTYLLAMVCSNMALQWVSYPTQVVGKSAKPIPVMLLGVLLGKKSYNAQKYLFITLIVLGVLLFMYKDQTSGQNVTFGLGELLIGLSLFMDGLTGAVQERMKSETKPTAHQMMYFTNYWSCIFLGVAIVGTGEIRWFVEFLSRHPLTIAYLGALSVTSAIGQLFIYLMVQEFGPLPCSIVTTTRKFFTVLASVIFFGNSLTGRQWLGTALVFLGLFLDTYYKGGPPKPNNPKPVLK